MGRRGPAPKPTALRLLHGDHPERVNKKEPPAPELPIERPLWLSNAAAMEWDQLAGYLAAMGTVKASDELMLGALCETAARWKMVAALCARMPPVFKRDEIDGQPVLVKNPLYAQARDLTAELRVMAREFGLTPSARAGLRVEVVAPGLSVDRLFPRCGSRANAR
jgi:P27 family predicted phage terminase small subunit